ncbi:hypothetical protein TIFTF001_029671 [Ficus carica]|uniref:Uncharacterized protein n=1 Tax=Ficus carica TaxID=3494 RepID=A0AA88DRZ9_FICCA|nr:hypothetical protein TIFTF001_029671 [Ficus carica]
MQRLVGRTEVACGEEAHKGSNGGRQGSSHSGGTMGSTMVCGDGGGVSPTLRGVMTQTWGHD